MVQPLPNCIQPKNDRVPVWRYMDLKKFLSILQTNCLYFTSVDNLEDDFEGSYPKRNIEQRFDFLQKIPEEKHEFYLNQINKWSDLHIDFKNKSFVNCWHANKDESIAMWKIYSENEEGIAIKSTYADLRKSIIDNRRVFMGVVNYINYDYESFDFYNALPAFFHKRLEFSYENEIRLFSDGVDEKRSVDNNQNKNVPGLNIKVDLDCLIEKVYVSPFSQYWFYEIVKNIMAKYGIEKEVHYSSLKKEPQF